MFSIPIFFAFFLEHSPSAQKNTKNTFGVCQKVAGKLVRSHKVTVSSGKRREKREMGQWRGKEGRWMERCTFSSMHLYTHTHTQCGSGRLPWSGLQGKAKVSGAKDEVEGRSEGLRREGVVVWCGIAGWGGVSEEM